MASCPSNPAHNVLYCPQHKTFFETKTNPIKPFSLWIENLVSETKYHVLPSNIITKRLPNSTSIYRAEAKAIDIALNIITQTESTKFIIFSDSLSVLTSIKNQNLDNPLTMQLLNRLEILSKTKEIELCWIPSYTGIKGNDQADSAAKTA